MPSPIFTHLLGTLALIGMFFSIAIFMSFVGWISYLEAQKARLSEIAESVAREIVEIVSVHTLGEGGFTYMNLNIPQTIGSSGYTIQLEEGGENRIIVRVYLQTYDVIRVVVVPNFGEGNVRVIDGEYEERGFIYSYRLNVPCNNPVVIVKRAVVNNQVIYYIALGRRG